MNMGYDREHVLVLPFPVEGETDLLKNSLSSIPDVKVTGRINALPGDMFPRFEIRPEGGTREHGFTAVTFTIDTGTLETLNIPIVSGRNFSDRFPQDLSCPPSQPKVGHFEARHDHSDPRSPMPIHKRVGIPNHKPSVRLYRDPGNPQSIRRIDL